MSAPCTQTDRIIKLEVNVNRLVKLIDDKDSGDPGLYQTVILLTNNQIKQGDNIDKLINIVDALKESNIRTDAEDKVISKLAKERQAYKQWVIGLSITVVIAVAGFVISMTT